MCMYNTLHVYGEVRRGVVSMATAGHTLLRGCWTKARWLYHFNTLSSCHVFLWYALREKGRVPTFINSYISLLPVKHRKRDLSAIFARLLEWCTLNRVEGDYKWLHLRQKARVGWIFNASMCMMEYLDCVFGHSESELWADDKGGWWLETNQSQSYMQSCTFVTITENTKVSPGCCLLILADSLQVFSKLKGVVNFIPCAVASLGTWYILR